MKIPPFVLRLMRLSPVYLPSDNLAMALDIANKYGDVAQIQLGNFPMYMLCNPELVHEMLVEKPEKFHKSEMLHRALEFAGNGLVTNEGDSWKRQRKLAQPAFHHKRIEGYAQMMVAQTCTTLESWGSGRPIGIFHEMMKTTLQIVAQSLFSTDVSDQVERLGELSATLLEGANDRLTIVPFLADKLPTPKHRREALALRDLHALIDSMIQARHRQNNDTGDLLSMLLNARDEATGEPMSDQQLRDEIITLILAGHETTAVALTWAWYLIAQHPEVEAKLRTELAPFARAALSLGDLSRLPYTEMVIKETMRLYPPAGGVMRSPIEDVKIGEYVFPKGSTIAVSSYVMHRSAQNFPNPESFSPERFSPEHEAEIPRYAYLPFGAGPRICIGNMFAMLEARLILATVLQHYTLALVPGQRIVPKQLFTTRPNQEIYMLPAPKPM
jgi:cytochrome P450